MPVYLFTYHSYRSWMPNRKRGFVQRGRGLQPANPRLHAAYEEAAKHTAFRFNHEIQRLVIETTLDVCQRREWICYAAGSDPSHVHVLVGWCTSAPFEEVRGKIRNIISLNISKHLQTTGRPWLADGSSRKRVQERQHFNYLITKYLPDHPGWTWSREGGWVAPRSG